jgi:protein-L-isoaspartate O-methyltransferase
MIDSVFFEGTGMPDPGWWEALWNDPAKVLTDVGIEPGMDVIDLCAGDGWFTLQLAKICNSVTAIDIDGNLLKAARIRLAERGHVSNVSLIETDAYDLGRFAARPVDHIFLANAFHGVPDKPRLSQAAHDALKPGAALSIINWHARPREETTVLGAPRGPATRLRMIPDQTIAAVTTSGLKHIHTLEVSPHHYAAVFQRVD